MRKKILVSIPTFNRSHYLSQLVEQINSLPYDEHDIFIHIVDDGSIAIHRTENEMLSQKYENITYTLLTKNRGKKKYYEVVNTLLGSIKESMPYDYYFYLPDDFTLCDDFFNKAIELWENIQDKDKICLSLFTDKERMQSPNWVEKIPDLIQFNQHHYYRSQWMDMCIISTRKFYEVLDYTIKKVSAKRWADYDAIGSGVGPQITKRLNKEYSLYHVANSLCFEEEHESKMNPNRIQGYTIQCNRRDYKCKVHVGIASIPSREQMLQRTVESLIYQADKIYVVLNGYDHIPEFLKDNSKIEVHAVTNHDMGDAGKFLMFLPEYAPPNTYFFTCDDDLLYPGDYVYTMINHIENNNRKAIIGLHGVTLKENVENYYKDRTVIPCLRSSINSVFVHILGTGAMAWHSSTLTPFWKDSVWEYKNMADIHFGICAQSKDIPMLCVKHAGEWLYYMEPEETIFDDAKNDCAKQTELVNSIDWKINTIEEKYNKFAGVEVKAQSYKGELR